MTTETTPKFVKGVKLHCETNNSAHHTDEITVSRLIVRRGQAFIFTVQLTEAFDGAANPVTITARTGERPQEDLGTESSFSIPSKAKPSPKAKAVWKADLQKSSLITRGNLMLSVTPPANCPIGRYQLFIKYKGKEGPLADLVVLFNPWCPDDSVYLSLEKKKKEYVLNEQGVVFRGSTNYMVPMEWDFGQFEEDMVDICLHLLDRSLSFMEDPGKDVGARSDPIHVGRVITAMVNSEDDPGVLQGNWSGDYDFGVNPTHWNGSHAILSLWYNNDLQMVKYGQCWVFACVMCSVMRLLGVPCRVVTNYASAHDVDRNLTIDRYHSAHGIDDRPSPDSVWNFHVWVECWFKRPDLSETGEFDGWQVLDPTPQETSGGVYRCGPAPVKAIKRGCTDLKYDIPFIYAEVNADCVDWLVYGEKETNTIQVVSDTKRVGRNISTKAVGTNHRRDITHKYKHKEGSTEERRAFTYAVTRDYAKVDQWEDESDEDTDEGEGPQTPPVVPEPPVSPPPDVTLRFVEVSQPVNGRDVSMNLVVQSESIAALQLTINISVQAMRYNGMPTADIYTKEFKKTLQPGKELVIPVVVPYSLYHQHMVKSESMKINAIVTEKYVADHTYLAECDVVLLDPDMEISVSNEVKVHQKTMVEMIFENPVEEMLTNCTMTMSGSGLLAQDFQCKLPDLNPGTRVRVKVFFVPYKKGRRTLMVDFDCSDFRDIQATRTINVLP